VDDGPAAASAAPGLSGRRLEAACRVIAALPPHPAVAGPAWWDAGAPTRCVTYATRASLPLPPAPWGAHRALAFCSELALALAPLHEAGVAHGGLCRDAVTLRPDGGPLVRAPGGPGTPADDLHGLGVLLLALLTGRSDHLGVAIAGEAGPAAETAALLEGLLAADPAQRPVSGRIIGTRLAEIAAAVPDVAPVARPERARRRRVRLATALVLLVVAGGSGAYVAGQRVGPPGPALSPATVTVPVPPPVSP
jgi:eukaryotic-like serine/threonine-protein kinase